MPKSASLQWPSWSNSTLSSLRSLKERASSICRTARPHTPMGWLVGWVIRPHQASFRHPPQRKQTSLGYLGKSFGSTLKICLMVPRQWSYVNRSPRLTTERQWFPLMVGGGLHGRYRTLLLEPHPSSPCSPWAVVGHPWLCVPTPALGIKFCWPAWPEGKIGVCPAQDHISALRREEMTKLVGPVSKLCPGSWRVDTAWPHRSYRERSPETPRNENRVLFSRNPR